MPRIFLAASLLVAAVFAGVLTGRAHRPQPQPVHGKVPFQRPGSMNRRRPPSVTPQQRFLSHDQREWYEMRAV
jgi:hypothetical protein